MVDGLTSSFSLPIAGLWSDQNVTWRSLLTSFSGTFAAETPLSANDSTPDHLGAPRWGDGHVAGAIRYSPTSFWFGMMTFNRYANPSWQRPWDPDYTYAFGYDDWHPYTLSLVYANYTGTRFGAPESAGAKRSDVQEGTLTLGWKLDVPARIEHALAGAAGAIDMTTSYGLTPDYVDAAGDARHSKQRAGLMTRYAVHHSWFVTATAYYYPHGAQQQPWDPDVTYGFGYYDWHPGKFSVQYNNYAGNHYPWLHGVPQRGRFRDGTVLVSWFWSTIP